jgi:cytoskeletal protein CcmA (bactofilin family)
MSKLFGSSPAKSGGSVDTLIGRQTEILGDVRFTGGLHVDGKIKGKVDASGDKGSSLSISESGSIEGDVRVPNIVLNGQVVGDVHASGTITLAAKARVVGNVYYRILEMEGGAAVNGQLVHETGSASAPSYTNQSTGDDNTDELREARRLKGL